MLDLSVDLRKHREAEARFRAGLARLLSEAGLELVAAVPGPEGHWSVELRPGDPVAFAVAAAAAEEEAWGTPGEAIVGVIELRPPPEVDPTRQAEPVVARPGDDLIGLVERGDSRLMVSPVREPIVGLRSVPLEPEERACLLAVTMVGDMCIDLRQRGVDPASPSARETVHRTRTSFHARAAEEGIEDANTLFAGALQAHAPAEFAAHLMEV